MSPTHANPSEVPCATAGGRIPDRGRLPGEREESVGRPLVTEPREMARRGRWRRAPDGGRRLVGSGAQGRNDEGEARAKRPPRVAGTGRAHRNRAHSSPRSAIRTSVSWTAPRGSCRPARTTTRPTGWYRGSRSTRRGTFRGRCSSTSRARYRTPTPGSGSWPRPRSGSPRAWEGSASATTRRWCSTPTAASCGRPGCGGCSARSGSTGRRCSTGGSRKWKAEGRPVSTEDRAGYPPARFDARPRPGFFVGRDHVLDRLGDGAFDDGERPRTGVFPRRRA